MLLNYELPGYAAETAAAAERVMEFAECTVWVKRLADGTLTATFSACNGRPELTVPLYQCVYIPNSGTGVFEDVSVIFVHQSVPRWWTYLGLGKHSLISLYLFSAKRGLCRPHPLQDMADWPGNWVGGWVS